MSNNGRILSEAERRRYIQRFKKLTIKNDFMFCKVLQNASICAKVITLLLKGQYEIPSLKLIIPQATIQNHAELKSVRLDVLAEDERGNSYDIEMQVINEKNIAKRSRAYLTAIDGYKMNKGIKYNELTDTIIIFICLFDPFGKGRAIYFFEEYNSPEKDIKLKNGTYKVIVNALAKENLNNEELKAFLKYISTGEVTSDLTREMEMEVTTIKEDNIITEKYVSFCARIVDAQNSGRRKGRKEGIKKGRKEGIIATAKNLLNMQLPIEDVIKATGLSKEEIEKL